MASGRLGTVDLAGGVTETLYTCPVDTFSVASVSIVNRSNSVATIRIAISLTGTPTNDEYIEYDTQLAPKSILERTGIVLDAGKNIVISSNISGVNAVAFGIETPTL